MFMFMIIIILNFEKTALAYCKTWHFFDASSAPVGRLATRIATLLQGKHKPIYHPIADCGDFVVVKNAKKLVLSGKKMEEKEWVRHTGYPGGLRITSVKKLMELNPSDVHENYNLMMIMMMMIMLFLFLLFLDYYQGG